MLPPSPTASPDLINGYKKAANLALRRSQRALLQGDGEEAKAWSKISSYCLQMVHLKAVDDDQYPRQRARLRNAAVTPMPNEAIDDMGLLVHVDARGGELSAEQETILELAMGYLSDTQRVIYEMVVGSLLEPVEVAEALDMDPGQVRWHLARAKRKIETAVRPRLKSIKIAIAN